MTPTDEKRIRLKKMALAMATLAIALVVAEVIIRRFFPSVPEGGHHRIFVEHHPTLGWQKKPGVTGKHVTSEYSITETMNSRGLRGPLIDYAKPTNTYRVVVLGDSFVEGYAVEFEDLFTEVTRRQLEPPPPPSPRYEIINMGTAGYSTDQELLLFEEEGVRYKPNLTVLVFYFNDVFFNTRSKYWRGNKPVFRLNRDALQLHGVPVPPPQKNFFEAVADWIYEASYLYRFCRDKSARLRRSGEKNKTYDSAPPTVQVMNTSPGPEVEDAWAVTASILKQLEQKTREAGSELMVLYAPIREAIHPGDWEQTRRAYGMTGDNWDPSLPVERLQAICSGLNIAFLDPSADLRNRATESKTRLYFRIDRHWNQAGHRAIGEILADHITSRPVSSR